MSVRTVASKFVELCRQGKNFDVMRTMYAPDIISVEGDGKETAGQIRQAFGSGRALSGRRECTDRNVIPVRISERELVGLSVRIHV
jgi:hypothetical protein